jgi:hypothetical protein
MMPASQTELAAAVGPDRRSLRTATGRSNVAEQAGGGLAKACRSSDVAVAGDSDKSRAGGYAPAQRQEELRRRDGEVTL